MLYSIQSSIKSKHIVNKYRYKDKNLENMSIL